MVTNQVVNAYRKSSKHASIHPVKLIHMMYERVLTHFEHAEAGVKEGDPKKRGENLGKAIAIITELNASVKHDDGSEAARFLRGLYNSILVELPKVSVSGDIRTLRQAHQYIAELKKIWEETAMSENGFGTDTGGREAVKPQTGQPIEEKMDSSPHVPENVQGVSVSI